MNIKQTIFEYLVEEMKKISGQLGSNEGGKFEDEHGDHYYKKTYRNGDQAKVEELTGKIYNKLGIKTVNPKYSNEDGKHVITTKWDDKIRPSEPSDYDKLSKDHAHQLATMHHGAVLTKNWDIVGLEHDNVMKHKTKGDFSSIDHGGAFHFRAMGGHKDYDPEIGEVHSLHNPSNASGHVFGEVKKQHPTAFHDTIHKVKALDDKEVHKDFKESGLSNWEELHKNFQERKKKLIQHYEK